MSTTGIKVGDYVQSRFRAPWKGTVIGLNKDIAWIRIEIDRHGHDMRKQQLTHLNIGWLRKTERGTEDA